MTQVFFVADGYNLLDDLIHLGHIGDNIRRIVGTEHHQIHVLDLYPIMSLKHKTVKVLLDAIVIEGGIG